MDRVHSDERGTGQVGDCIVHALFQRIQLHVAYTLCDTTAGVRYNTTRGQDEYAAAQFEQRVGYSMSYSVNCQ